MNNAVFRQTLCPSRHTSYILLIVGLEIADIDQLLATLGGWNKDSIGEESSGSTSWNSNASEQNEAEMDERVLQLTDELQEWRSRNVETPYKDWSSEQQQEFSVRILHRIARNCS